MNTEKSMNDQNENTVAKFWCVWGGGGRDGLHSRESVNVLFVSD